MKGIDTFAYQRPQGAPVIVGLSGGVDSAVCALLLRERGYDVRALFMKNWEEDDRDDYCAAARDLADAEEVCHRLDIPLHTVNFSTEYWDQVFGRFLAEFARGLTPNPDILCNQKIKFRAFFEHALNLGGSYIATGHYARISRDSSGFHLHKGMDSEKDQSYFLYTLDKRPLAKTLFPVGELPKSEVRRLARSARLPVHDKKDSTGICFIGERPFKAFLERYITPSPGNIESAEGEIIGRHDGLAYYTLGQRQGLGIGGRRGANSAPWYVVDKDRARNALIVVQGRKNPLLYKNSLVAEQLHWIAGAPPPFPLRCRAKVRYRQPDQDCEVMNEGEDLCRVHFRDPQWAITPGQSVVFYRGDECLGGGIIGVAE
uniref:tRNA-specific 2-thiouridylase MnmA n=1 Tax=Candidatus Kentrum sp. MB TaxID=2138164 RepID=A0A450XHK7_9GAMM|nr:MAG: tRNA (5-methylaminomethyl-2-thiouridylate)-methyltransferase [Candidatus Kentron sp. MB]VFK36000.1 MAG: tRNA (5-methylaminomethyl-2-thiouridylate)-methyltransferase [Candidatus Kentron sp. MB]VFK77602.1 MAG: tRNA (5-methylaminomethyl-2-thiouridylate)-methyltransferase [Candidatus Kentron sp. MB]